MYVQQQLAYRVSEPDKVSWTGLRAAWKEEPFFQAVNERTGEILFVRHITLLQMKEAEAAKQAAAEVCTLSAHVSDISMLPRMRVPLRLRAAVLTSLFARCRLRSGRC